MEKIKISQAIVVEGKYDKIKLSSFIDAKIIVTNGFGIFKDEQIQKLIRTYAKTCGIIVVTDSDSAGFVIRNFIKNIVGKENRKNVFQVYIPEIYGKESRKDKPSKEGKLGVEGLDIEIIKKALEKVDFSAKEKSDPITNLDFFKMGLNGKPDSGIKRDILKKAIDAPTNLTSKGLLEYLNELFTREEFFEFFNNLC